jgi:hypothetical protein
MHSIQRIVTSAPLTELWDSRGDSMDARRGGYLAQENIARLLRNGSSFVIADVGHPLRWISDTDRFPFWKTEVECRLVSPDENGFHLDDYPGSYCYVASLWEVAFSVPIIVLEKHH